MKHFKAESPKKKLHSCDGYSLNLIYLLTATAEHKAGSALACLETWVLFVDHIKAATTAHNLTVAIPIFKSF